MLFCRNNTVASSFNVLTRCKDSEYYRHVSYIPYEIEVSATHVSNPLLGDRPCINRAIRGADNKYRLP